MHVLQRHKNFSQTHPHTKKEKIKVHEGKRFFSERLNLINNNKIQIDILKICLC